MNWTTILANESRKNSLLRLDDLVNATFKRLLLAMGCAATKPEVWSSTFPIGIHQSLESASVA